MKKSEFLLLLVCDFLHELNVVDMNFPPCEGKLFAVAGGEEEPGCRTAEAAPLPAEDREADSPTPHTCHRSPQRGETTHQLHVVNTFYKPSI